MKHYLLTLSDGSEYVSVAESVIEALMRTEALIMRAGMPGYVKAWRML